MPNPAEFKQLLLNKYPAGVASDGRKYSDIPDTELTQMVVDKFPQGVTNAGIPYKNYLGSTSQEQISQKSDLRMAGESTLNFLKNRFTASPEYVQEQKREGELFFKVRDKTATPEERVEYEKLAKKGTAEAITMGLGFTPSNLPGIPQTSSKVVQFLREGAEKNMSRALGATKEAYKKLSQKIAPELIKRGVVAGSRKGLLEKAETSLESAGERLGQELERVPKGTMIGKKPILESVEKYKDNFITKETLPNGKVKITIVDNIGYQNAKKMENLINQYDDQVSFETMRRVRQILDSAVTKGGKTFGRTLNEGSLVDAQREMGNSIRRELAKTSPDVAKANAEYSFWSNVISILEETIKRTSSQSTPLGEQIATGAGAAAGFAKGGFGKSAIVAGVFKLLVKATRSTGWNTVSAVGKNRIADYIASNQTQKALDLMKRLGLVTVAEINEFNQNQK